MEQDICYNILTGNLPECLQLGRISELLSERLRKLPTSETRIRRPPSIIRSVSDFEQVRPKSMKVTQNLTWHTGKKKRFFGLKRRIVKDINNRILPLISVYLRF